MKAGAFIPLVLLAAAFICGCQSYVYRVVRPTGIAQPIASQTVVVHYDPLEYRLARHHDRLDIRINNPTDDSVVLLSSRSYVIDPQGESHRLQSLVIGPHSFSGMLVPPEPIAYTTFGWGDGWAWGWQPFPPGDPTFVDSFPTAVFYTQVNSPYDWEWETGAAKIHLSYTSNQKTFDHNFEIIREPEKR